MLMDITQMILQFIAWLFDNLINYYYIDGVHYGVLAIIVLLVTWVIKILMNPGSYERGDDNE